MTWRKITRDDAKKCVGPGWSTLIDEAYDAMPEDTVVLQVKEKFGGLRIYVGAAPGEFHDLLHELEGRSLTMCEECGGDGHTSTTGWMRTLCARHHAERGL